MRNRPQHYADDPQEGGGAWDAFGAFLMALWTTLATGLVFWAFFGWRYGLVAGAGSALAWIIQSIRYVPRP